MNEHKCAIRSCTTDVPGDKLLCLVHWRVLPSQLRYDLYATWRQGQLADTPEHLAAIDAATKYVNVMRLGG